MSVAQLLDHVRGSRGRWQTSWNVRRAASVTALVGVLAGAAALTAGVAQAAGGLTVVPASGPSASTPTWTSVACPAGFQGSARLDEFRTDGTLVATGISPVVQVVTSGFSGTLVASVGSLLMLGTGDGGTLEWEVGCFSGPDATGNVVYPNSIFVSLSADGSTYATSESPPPTQIGTTTTMTASPDPAVVNEQVTLSALVATADGSIPDGSVLFEANGMVIGGPVPVLPTGLATTTTSFAAAGTEQLSATFLPASMAYAQSVGTFSETVQTIATTVTLAASPNPAAPRSTITLSAVGTAADGTHPAGSVQFAVNGTDIGSPVAVDSTGTATTTTSFAKAGTESLSAVFTPADTGYLPSAGTFSETIQKHVRG